MSEVTLDGVWLGSLGHVSDVSWGTRWGSGPCGPFEASCTLAIEPTNETKLLRLNAIMRVFRDDGTLAFAGPVIETGRGYPRTIQAKGWSRLAADFEAIDLNPYDSVADAIGRGLRWSDNPFSATDLGAGINESPPRLDALLNKAGSLTGDRWGVDELGVAFVAQDATTHSYLLDATDLDIGLADDGLFTSVRARYVSAVTGTPPEATTWGVETATDTVAAAIYGTIEFPLDLTPLGLISSGTAAAYAAEQLVLLNRPQWLSRVAVTSRQLLSPAGTPVDLQSVKAGEMVRLFNIPSRFGGIADDLNLNVVLGEVSYSDASPSEVTLAPLNLAVSNIADGFEKKAAA